MNKHIYPICFQSFTQLCLSNVKYNKLYNNLGCPKPFDVTLRDGLQALSKKEQETFTLKEKINLYNHIRIKYSPKNIEIGSIVSERVLPIFRDTLELFDSISDSQKQLNSTNSINNYIVVPNKEKLKQVENTKNLNYFSFITSISNSFQVKNTKMSLKESDEDIKEMINILYNVPYKTQDPTIKLYISCINECPMEGKIDNDVIVNRILNLHKLNINKLCLSDTCGSLEVDDLEYILDTCKIFGLPMSKLSLHLHVISGRESIVQQLIHMALDRNITDFDVSLLESGGCSVTMNKTKLKPNLSYELYYKSLASYIIKKSDI